MNAIRAMGGALLVAGAALCAALPAYAQAGRQPCNIESVKEEAAKNDGLRSALTGVLSTSRCTSLLNILRQIISGKITTGRKLEPDRPFNIAEAERQLATARANAEIQAAIAAELADETNPARRLLLEAVVMHDKRQLLARDLLLQQLDGQRNP